MGYLDLCKPESWAAGPCVEHDLCVSKVILSKTFWSCGNRIYTERNSWGKIHICLPLAVSLCSNNSVPSAHRVTHHLCVSDSQSGLFSGLSQSSRPVVHLFLGTIFHQHGVFKSFLIFALKLLLLLILSLHPQTCQHYCICSELPFLCFPSIPTTTPWVLALSSSVSSLSD